MENNMNVNNFGNQNGQDIQSQEVMQITPVHQIPVTPINGGAISNVTTLQDLQSYAQGVVVRFPDFAEGQPLIARVRRPSMLSLAQSGQIPNSLLRSAGDLFKGSDSVSKNGEDEGTLKEMYEVCRIVCNACLRSPSMAEIEQAGLQLTDEQIMAIFNYTQVGVKALESFRKE